MALQPGMAFRWKTHSQSNDDDDATAVFEGEVFLCLASLKWGVLAWALTRESMESWRLDTNRNIEWKFILDVSDIESAEALPMLEDESGVKVVLADWEPVARTALRLFSTPLTVVDLKILATVGLGMKHADVDSLLRPELLKAVALKVGDEDFAEQIRLANVNKKSEEGGDETGWDEGENNELANMLFQMMDPSDMDEFRDLKNNVDKKQKAQKVHQWKQWMKEADDVSWCI